MADTDGDGLYYENNDDGTQTGTEIGKTTGGNNNE